VQKEAQINVNGSNVKRGNGLLTSDYIYQKNKVEVSSIGDFIEFECFGVVGFACVLILWIVPVIAQRCFALSR
jgi:hypothetical protein